MSKRHNPRPVAIEDAPPVAPVASHKYHFPGTTPYLSEAMAGWGLPPHIRANLAASVPIRHLGRVLAGLAELSGRNRRRPLLPTELAAVRSALLGVDEVRWHYRIAATACFEATAEARRAFVMPTPDDGGEMIPEDAPGIAWNFTGLAPFLDAEARRLGLSAVVARRAAQSPEVHRIATRLASVASVYRKAPRDHDGRPLLTLAERDTVRADLDCAGAEASGLAVLATGAESMLMDAYHGFGLSMPDSPDPSMPECPGCNPALNTRRTAGRLLPYFA